MCFAVAGIASVLVPKYDLKKHPNYKYTAEADKRNVFDITKLINRRMKLKLNELYTVYKVDVTGDGADINEDEDILNYDDIDDPQAFI